jgi:hypothetical protein
MNINDPSKGKATHNKPVLVLDPLKGFVRETERRQVRILAVAEGYAMVRRPRAVPYVCPIKELTQP